MTSPADRRRPRLAAVAATLVVALASLLAACGSGEDAATTSTTKASDQVEGIVRPKPLQVGDLALPAVEADGASKPFPFQAEPGKLLFVAFGYTNCPDVCPTTLYDIKKARKKLGDQGKDVQVAFATVDPERDTPEGLTAYVGSFAPDGTALRTEDPDELKATEDGFGVTSTVVKNDDGSTDVAHTARSFVVDDQGDVVVEWSFGTGADAMAHDLRLLFEQQAARS